MPPCDPDNDAQTRSHSAEAGPPPSGLSPALSFPNLLKAFRHRWPLAVAAALALGAGLGAAVWFLLPTQYTAYALLQVASTQPQLLPDDRSAHDDDHNFENTQVALIKSRPILLAALRRPKVGELAVVRQHADPAAWLEDELKAGFIEKTDIIKVSFTGPTRPEAAVLVNAVKDAYLEQGVNAQRNQKLAFLDDLEKVYLASEEKLRGQRDVLRQLADTLKSSDSEALSAKQKMTLDEYAAVRREQMLIQSQLRNAEVTLAVQKAEPVADKAAVPDSLLDQAVASDPLILKKQLEVDQAQAKIDQALRTYNPGQGPLPKYEAELNSVKAELEKLKLERRQTVTAAAADRLQVERDAKALQLQESVEVWKRQDAELQEEVDRLGKEAQKIGVASFELELKRGEIEQAEAVIKRLRDERERLQVELQSSSQRVTVLHPAEVPDQPDSTTRVRLAALGGVGGLLLGLFGVSFWEARDRRIRSKDEVAGELGLRVVGTLPALPRPAELTTGAVAPRRRGANHAAVWVASVDAIRAAVLCDAEERTGVRALLVTSALAREGKTTLACHLAVSLARAGKRVLLVDCDTRRPRLHDVFGCPRGPGLSEALAGEAPLAEAVHAGPVEGLAILPIGRNIRAVGEALAQQRMRQFIDEARRACDFLLLDGCPVLPVADALSLGRLVDGVLLSVRPGRSQLTHVAAASERLADLRIPVVGAVVNGGAPADQCAGV